MSTQHTRYAQASPPVAALVDFRTGFFRCLTGWADAAFELCDAALCAPAPVTSVPTLSLEPAFRRSHGSLYKALSLGRIDHEGMRDLLVAHRPTTWPAVFAVDASTWARCDAETSPERGFYYSASKHSAGQPIVAGWSYQWITQLDWAFDSWTAPVDAARIPPTADATTFTIKQVTRLVQRLPDDGQVPMFVFDAGYDPIAIGAALTDTAAQVLVRIRGDRVFYTDPNHRSAGTLGRPRRHGTRFALSDPAGAPVPTAELSVQDKRHGRVHVSSWTGLHPKLGCRGRWADNDLPTHRGRHSDPRRRRAPTQAQPQPTEDAVAVVVRTGRTGPRPMLACLPAPLRHRAHLPLHQKHPRLDHTGTADPRPSRPLDLAGRRRLHPTAPGSRARRRPTPALGTTPRPRQTHPRARPQRVSTTPPNPGHTSQCAEIRQTRTRAPKKHPTTAPNPLPSHQESRITLGPRVKSQAETSLVKDPVTGLTWPESVKSCRPAGPRRPKHTSGPRARLIDRRGGRHVRAAGRPRRHTSAWRGPSQGIA